MSIFEVRHQPRAQRLLQRALASDRLPHAYILAGPEGVGRELFARRAAKMFLCPQPAMRAAAEVHVTEGFVGWRAPLRDACGECESCRAVAADSHPDLHFVYRELIKHHPDPAMKARKGLQLGVEVIREFLIRLVANKPLLGHAKVFIIREADKMNVAAQNALLKTLEEPPETTFLMLIVTSVEALLPTVRSRCQTLPFGLLPPEFVADELARRNAGVTPEQADVCATYANGSLGVAQRNVEDKLWDFNERMGEILVGLPQAGVQEAAKQMMNSAKELGGAHKDREEDASDTECQRQGLKTLLALLAGRYRCTLHIGVGSDAMGSTSQTRGAPAWMSSLTPRRIGEAIRTIVTTERQLDANANAQLCVESLLIRLRGMGQRSP